jgi:hypothetical protein
LSTPNFERRSTTPQVEYYSVASSANIDEQRMGREGGTPGSIQKSTESPYVSCSRMPPQPVEIPLPALVDCPEQGFLYFVFVFI